MKVLITGSNGMLGHDLVKILSKENEIIATTHDTLDITDIEYPDILNCEIASLYIPAYKKADAIMKIKHVGNVEYKINQSDCAKEFLLKVIEIICGGGIYHEENYN